MRLLAVFHDAKPFQSCTKFNGEALKAQTNAKDGQKVLFIKLPKILDNTDILANIWRARTWTDDND
jgi:hypothetical protein